MNGAQHSMKNTIKNISLVALVLLLALLSVVNWLAGMNTAQMPAGNLLRRAHDRLFGGAVGYELRTSGVAAASPAQMALTVDGGLAGVQYDPTETEAALEATRALWTQAMDGQAMTAASDEQLAAALLSGDCAVLRYHGAIALNVIAGWLGGEWDSTLAAETLVYTAGTEQIFVRAGNGGLFAAPAYVEGETLAKAQQAFRGLPCAFAGSAYAVYPETLLFEKEVLSLPVLRAEAPHWLEPQSGAGLELLLDAFGYTPYERFYDEQGKRARVFVGNTSTLRVGADGLVQYAAAESGSTVYAYDEGEAGGLSALGAQIDCARLILDAVLRAAGSDTHASLYTIQQDRALVTLVFLQLHGGVPVLGNADFATFRFEGGALHSATIRLQCFETTQDRRVVLPARQAAAGASEAQRSLLAAYRERDGLYVPARYYL